MSSSLAPASAMAVLWSAAETPAANVTTYGRTGAGVEVGAGVGSGVGSADGSAEGSEGGAVGSGVCRRRGRRGFRCRLGGRVGRRRR